MNKVIPSDTCAAARRLSPMETKIYPLIVQGLSCKQIAEITFRSPKTIATYTYRSRDKMNLDLDDQGNGKPPAGASMNILVNHIRLLKKTAPMKPEAQRENYLDGYLDSILALQHPSFADVTEASHG